MTCVGNFPGVGSGVKKRVARTGGSDAAHGMVVERWRGRTYAHAKGSAKVGERHPGTGISWVVHDLEIRGQREVKNKKVDNDGISRFQWWQEVVDGAEDWWNGRQEHRDTDAVADDDGLIMFLCVNTGKELALPVRWWQAAYISTSSY